TSLVGHWSVSVENEDGSECFAIGYYPAKKGLLNLLFGQGMLKQENSHRYFDYAVVSKTIGSEDLLRVLELARNRFSRSTYSLGGQWGGSDCSVFAEAACRAARIEVPPRGWRIWNYWPHERIKSIYRANEQRPIRAACSMARHGRSIAKPSQP